MCSGLRQQSEPQDRGEKPSKRAKCDMNSLVYTYKSAVASHAHAGIVGLQKKWMDLV